MKIRVFAAIALVTATPAAIRAQSPAPLIIDSSEGPIELSGIDIGWFAENPETIELVGDGTALGHGQVDAIECRHELNLDILLAAVKKLLRQHRLSKATASLGNGQLVYLTNPVIVGSRASYYSFFAAMAPCANTCSLKVSAWKVSAPYDAQRRSLQMTAARKGNDDITGALIDVGEAEFQKCRR